MMTAKEFRQEKDYPYNHFTKLTSTGISPNYDNIEEYAEVYHQAKVKNLGIFGVMPRNLTVENGAKNLLCGEFNEMVEVSNPEYCGCGECDFCIEHDDVDESYMIKVPVAWTTIKDIYAKIVAFYGA